MYLQYIDEFINAVSSKEESLSVAETLELENKASSILKGFISGRLEVFDHGTYNMEFVVLAPSVYSVDYPSTVYFDTFFQKEVALRMVYSYIHKEYDIINSPEVSMPDMANYLDYITPQIIDSLELFHYFFSRDEEGQEMILYRIRAKRRQYSKEGIAQYGKIINDIEMEIWYLSGMVQEIESDEDFHIYFGSERKSLESNVKIALASIISKRELLNLRGEVKREFEESNSHLNIFSEYGFKLFDYLMRNHLASGFGLQSDISFFYRKMVYDKYIHAKQAPFRDFLEKVYPNIEPIGKLKLFDDVRTENREKVYSSAKSAIGLK